MIPQNFGRMKAVLLVLFLYIVIEVASARGFQFYKQVTPYADNINSKTAEYQNRLTRDEYLQWKAWKKEHSRDYNNINDDLHRAAVWLSNKRYVEEHNRISHVHGYTLKMNHFGDLTLEEWTKFYNCHKLDSFTELFQDNYKPPVNWTSDSPPFSMDWRSRNAVTGIKNQEEYRCHSCYAFAALGALEGAHAIASGNLVSLSAQQIVDCSRRYANSGCQGGNYKFAWNYIIHNGGADKASCYRYKPKQNSNCQHSGKCIAATMSGYSTVRNEDHLKAAVGNSGPVAVTFDHRRRSFQFYSGGVYNNTNCSSGAQNATHEMVVVGYGINKIGVPYWIVKNSYGSNWGIRGYIYVHRGSNMCGIASNAALPTI